MSYFFFVKLRAQPVIFISIIKVHVWLTILPCNNYTWFSFTKCTVHPYFIPETCWIRWNTLQKQIFITCTNFRCGLTCYCFNTFRIVLSTTWSCHSIFLLEIPHCLWWIENQQRPDVSSILMRTFVFCLIFSRLDFLHYKVSRCIQCCMFKTYGESKITYLICQIASNNIK